MWLERKVKWGYLPALLFICYSVFHVKSSVSCRYFSRMWYSKRVTKSLLSSVVHNLSLSKICKCFFLLDGWEQNINASVWVTLSTLMSMTAINHKWVSKQGYWNGVLQIKQYCSKLGYLGLLLVQLWCSDSVLLALYTLQLEWFWECSFVVSGTCTTQELEELEGVRRDLFIGWAG